MRQRIPEVWLRLALGASSRRVLGTVLRPALRVTAIATTIGVLAAIPFTLTLANLQEGRLLIGVGRFDPVTLIGVVALVVGVTVAACAGPGRSASRMEPATALRVDVG